MKKFTLSFVLLLTTVLGISAAETTIWEGTQAGNLDFTVGTDLHTLLVNTVKAGDVMTISYTGATESSKLWLQDSSWDTYAGSITGVTTDLLTAGAGTYQVTISQTFIDAFTTGGLKLRRGGDAGYTFTKVTLAAGQSGGGEQGGGEQGGGATGTITIWEGTSTESIYMAPESDLYNKMIGDGSTQANLSVGDKIKFYYTGAAADTQIWLQANWDGLSGEGSMPSITGDGSCEFYINAADLASIKTSGLRFRIGQGSCTFTKIEVIKKQESGSGTEGAIVVWEGLQAGNLRFMPGDANFTALTGSAEGQANLGAMDTIKFYYTGATENDQVWFQNVDWSNLQNIDPSSPTITAGDGSYEFVVNAAALAEILEKGIMLRRPSTATYSFTKVEVIKYVPDANVAVPGDDETVLWSGSVKASSGKAFRYGDERANFINALSVGKYLHVYMSNVVEGNQIYFKDVTTWGWINEGQINLTAEQQIYTFQVTQDMIDKVNVGSGDYGLLIQGKSTDEYEIRFVTISDSESTGIERVENTFRPIGVAYNLQGQRVSVSTKGLIIINGKKFLNK